jgi:hypothetical protein
MTGSPIYDPDQSTWTWTWSSWVPTFLQIESNKGKSFWWDQDLYDTLSPADQSTYQDLMWGQWYYEGSDFGSYSKPIIGYNAAAAPYKIRFVLHDGGGRGVRFQTKNIALKGSTNTYVSGWRTMQSDFWTISAAGNYLPPTSWAQSNWQMNDYVIGDGVSAMWYTGSGDFGATGTRTLELKDPVNTSDWESTRLEFDTAYWLEGSDTAQVEYSTDGGQNWSTLYGSELRKAEQVQDPDPAHWIWHEGWYDPDMGETYPGWWEKPLITLPLPQASSTASMTGASKDGWVHKSYDISYGAPVKIRFVYHNGADSAAWGWGINHITISNASEQGLSKTQSADVANWNASSWSRYGSQGKMWYPLAGGWTPWTRVLGMKSLAVPANGSTTMSFMTQYDFGQAPQWVHLGYYDGDPWGWSQSIKLADGYVEASTDGGNTWEPLTGTVDGVSRSVVASETNSGGKWIPASYNLSAYAGQTIKVRFRMETWPKGNGGYAHWGVDNIGISNSVSGGIFADDVETSKAQWDPTYWVRANGAVVGMGGDAWGY